MRALAGSSLVCYHCDYAADRDCKGEKVDTDDIGKLDDDKDVCKYCYKISYGEQLIARPPCGRIDSSAGGSGLMLLHVDAEGRVLRKSRRLSHACLQV